MPQPALASFAQGLYDALAPVSQDDEANGWALAYYCAAIGQMFQEVEDYARDSTVNGKDASGWSSILDINRVPTKGLPWLAQFVGVQLLSGLSDAEQRDRVRSVSGWNRGTPAAIRAAAQQYLIGSKSVIIRERFGGPYQLTVITFIDETPDPTAVHAAVLAEKPAGLVLDYHTLAGQDFELVREREVDFSAVIVDYANFDLLRGFSPADLGWPEVGTYPDIDTYPLP